MFITPQPYEPECERDESSQDFRVDLSGTPETCVVWVDEFEDERGFLIVLKYWSSGEIFVYEAGPDITQLFVPHEHAPRLDESQEQFLRRHDIQVSVVALRPNGRTSKVGDTWLTVDNPDLRKLPIAMATVVSPFGSIATTTSGPTPTALFIIPDTDEPECDPTAESQGARVGVGQPGFCIVWIDGFNDESGFHVLLKYPITGEIFVYETGPNVTQLLVPELHAPRLGESQQQFLRRHVWEVWVYALRPAGPWLVDGMAAETDDPGLLKRPTATQPNNLTQ